MATTHAPPTFQSHAWSFSLDNTQVKTEKTIQQEEENEYNDWFNADEFPSLNNSTSSAGSSPVSSPTSAYSPQQAQQIANVFNLVSSSAVYTQPFTLNTASASSTTTTTSSSSPSSVNVPLGNINTPLSAFPFCIGIAPSTSQPLQVNGVNQGQTLNLIPIPLVGANQPNSSNQMIPQMIVLPNFGFNQQQLTVNPQFYSLMLTQFQSLRAPSSPSSSDESSDEPKKKGQKNTQRRIRQTRPKVVEAKGAVQCVGRNRKKNAQCRNAALMEYIGPRPVYCAEHIELDPASLYEKCKSSYQKEVDDKKGCKEVVLKEFGLCYKHYGDTVAELVKNRDIQTAKRHFDRITDLLEQLEREAAAAKKKDGDLYQRKNKLIPKFQEMKKTITKGLEELQSKEVDALRAELSAPVFLKIAQQSTAAESVDASYSPFAHANAHTAGQSPIHELDATRLHEHFS